MEHNDEENKYADKSESFCRFVDLFFSIKKTKKQSSFQNIIPPSHSLSPHIKLRPLSKLYVTVQQDFLMTMYKNILYKDNNNNSNSHNNDNIIYNNKNH